MESGNGLVSYVVTILVIQHEQYFSCYLASIRMENLLCRLLPLLVQMSNIEQNGLHGKSKNRENWAINLGGLFNLVKGCESWGWDCPSGWDLA